MRESEGQQKNNSLTNLQYIEVNKWEFHEKQ
uniref:Uncharacterized protein n=1 Tax=Rhizophora mucronata TaxID=61149 RepID=A0A2P2Q8W7_RHIMU